MTRNAYLISCSTSALLALVAGPALAQSTAAAPAETQQDTAPGRNGEQVAIGDIIVTARRVEERLQDVPVAITAVTGEDLTKRGISQVQDLRMAVAGLNVNPAAGRTTSVIFALRGQRAVDIAVTQDPAVAIYLDEAVVTPLQGSNLGLFDLANVQVLKGPQGTLFGRNSTGGAVLFTSAKPTDVLEGYVKVGYGNYDTKTAQAVLNLPLSEAIRLRGGVDYTKRDGFGVVRLAPSTPTTRPQGSVGRQIRSRDELNFRLTAAIDPSDRLKTITTVYHSKATNGTPGYRTFDFNPLIQGQSGLVAAAQRVQSYGRYDAESDIPQKTGEDVSIFGVINTINLEISDNITFKNIASFRRTKLSEFGDFDGTIIPVQASSNFTFIKQYTEEAQFQGNALDNKLTFVAGAYYFLQKGRDGSNGGESFGRGLNSIGGPLKNTSYSLFAQGTYALTDTLNLTAGGRYTWDKRRYALSSRSGSLDNPGACLLANNPNCVINAAANFAKPTWTVTLDKKLSPDTLVYLSHRRGYRAGGFNLRGASPALIGPFNPEIVSDVELGLKTSWDVGQDWKVRANLAGYHQWYQDIQRAITGFIGNPPAVGNTIINAARAKIYGGEFEFDISSAFAGLSFNYSYVKPKYDDFQLLTTINGVPNVPFNRKGQDFVFIPRHQINVNGRISPDLGDFGKLDLIASLYYQSKVVFSEEYQTREDILRFYNAANGLTVPQNLTLSQKGYALVNLRAELKNINGSGLSAALFANNLLDKSYITASSIFYVSLGLNQGVYGDPRTYGAELKYRF